MINNEDIWHELHIDVSEDLVDAVSNFFHENGASGVVENNVGVNVRLTAYIPDDPLRNGANGLEELASALRDLFPASYIGVPESSLLKNENWAVMWKDNFTTIELGANLIITPPWLPVNPKDTIVIIIEPAEAFGTGTHETTQGCLILLENAINLLIPEPVSMLDLGCGSGILAIAAKKLGAVSVDAVDNDPAAVQATQRNVLLNDLTGLIDVRLNGPDQLSGRRSIVAANLDFKTITGHWTYISPLVENYLVVSGILKDQWQPIERMCLDDGLQVVRLVFKNEWVSGLLEKKLF